MADFPMTTVSGAPLHTRSVLHLLSPLTLRTIPARLNSLLFYRPGKEVQSVFELRCVRFQCQYSFHEPHLSKRHINSAVMYKSGEL